MCFSTPQTQFLSFVFFFSYVQILFPNPLNYHLNLWMLDLTIYIEVTKNIKHNHARQKWKNNDIPKQV